MVNLTIDGLKVSVRSGTTILSAAGAVGIEIPRFCYQEELSIAGNCRMCLVQVKNSPKPVASCAMPVNEGMIVETTTDMVKKAREGVMELLLKNHPLDCPICDQAGECDLQDQAIAYGSDKGRHYGIKRTQSDNYNTGPLIKTNMNRCIHCTRCIRFAEEIGGVPVYGTTGRGEETQVGTYIEKLFKSPLSGNVIDLCPVGALTNKQYSYEARPWELKHTASYDIHDITCSPILVDSIGDQIKRVLPRLDKESSPWISDRTRFSIDGLSNDRLEVPLIKEGTEFKPISWEDVYNSTNNLIKNAKHIACLAGSDTNIETLEELKLLDSGIKGNWNLPFKMNTNFNDPEFINKTIVLYNVDLKVYAPTYYAKLGQLARNKQVTIFTIGIPLDFLDSSCNYSDINKVKLTNNSNTLILYNTENLVKDLNNKKVLVQFVSKMDKVELQPIHSGPAISQSISMDAPELTLWPLRTDLKSIDLLYLVNYDDVGLYEYLNKIGNNKVITIYQGHHSDKLAQYAQIILPGATFTEESAKFMNCFGKIVHTRTVTKPNWSIRSNYNILSTLIHKNQVMKSKTINTAVSLNELMNCNIQVPIEKKSFYLYNSICRASKTMRKMESLA